jgi:hypothetical protein
LHADRVLLTQYKEPRVRVRGLRADIPPPVRADGPHQRRSQESEELRLRALLQGLPLQKVIKVRVLPCEFCTPDR